LATQHYNFENPVLYSFSQYIFSATHPTGEIKDLIYDTSESRRGKPHTYAYVIGLLTLSQDAQCVDLANNSLI
jgi:hypothetical protein